MRSLLVGFTFPTRITRSLMTMKRNHHPIVIEVCPTYLWAASNIAVTEKRKSAPIPPPLIYVNGGR